MTKQELRRQIRLEKQLRQSRVQSCSEQIVERLRANRHLQNAQTVLLYYPLADEVQIQPLLSLEKRVLLPVIDGDDLQLRVYEGEQNIRREERFHIGEPVGEAFVDYDSIDCCVVPGVAFDALGHRLGRGKGFYDRLLPRLHNAHLIGVCFGWQVVEEVPSEAHDIKMDEIVYSSF